MTTAATAASPYLDLNEAVWRSHWEKGQHYEEYVTQSQDSARYLDRWRAIESRVSATEEQTRILKTFTRRMPVIIVSGLWCGDCSRQVPMIEKLARETNGMMEVRLFDRDEHPALMDALRILGAKRVPTVLYLSEDFHEVGRFGDRMLSTYRKKAVNELGPACATGLVPPAESELAIEMQEWMDVTERMQLMLRLAPRLRQRHGD